MAKRTVASEHHEPAPDDQGGVATAEPPAEQSAPVESPTFSLRVKCGAVSQTKKGSSISIGFAVQDQRHLLELHKHLVESRVQCTLRVVSEDDGDTDDMFVDPFNDVADFHKMSVSKHAATGKLSFNCDDDDRKRLLDFYDRAAKLTWSRVGVAGADPDGSADDEDGDDDDDNAQLFDGDEQGEGGGKAPQGADAWKPIKIGVLQQHGVTAKQIEILQDHNITTLGKYGELGVKHGAYWHRDIKGIGPEVAGKIGDAYNAYLLANPHLTTDAPTGEPGNLLDWKQSESSSHVAFAYSGITIDGAEGYGYWIDQAGEKFVLTGDREVVAEESEHDTLDAAKGAAEALERQHRAAAEQSNAA